MDGETVGGEVMVCDRVVETLELLAGEGVNFVSEPVFLLERAGAAVVFLEHEAGVII